MCGLLPLGHSCPKKFPSTSPAEADRSPDRSFAALALTFTMPTLNWRA